ncbi:glucokinase [Haloechinothrix alba]|uniref:Glucokinase n=1 Tax=Haloechinothrix alba TaxID=664784 RepID=A0A238VNP2_9PSEU|nr:ROK family protein [Haloechinothrix alba]SNR35801.1 glucokinase [Haloechinothrix alba]
MLTVGVDVGGTSVQAGVIDKVGAVIDTARVATPGEEGALEDAIAGVVDQLGQRHQVRAVGLAVAGFIAADRRTVMYAPHLAWRDAPVVERVRSRTGLPVVLEHDANAAAVAEHRYGTGRGARVMTLIALGTGIGGAVVLDGEIFRGAHGVAPELGHLRVVSHGRPCSCGKQGCWERYCSGTGLATTAIELLARHPGRSTVLAREATGDPGSVTGRRVAAAARDGDPIARQAMAELARWLGDGLALVADVYDPDLIVIAGGVSESAPLFLDDARDHYRTVLTGMGHRPLARIRTAQLADEAGMVGAGVLAREGLAAARPTVRSWSGVFRRR